MNLTVVLPTFNPNLHRLARTLRGLQAQTLSKSSFNLLLVDNGSTTAVDEGWCKKEFDGQIRVITEPEVGLAHARLAGIVHSSTDKIVMCDDDNVLSSDYLEKAVELLSKNPRVGAAGGKNQPVFEQKPPDWYFEGIAPLGCRDLGDLSLYCSGSDYQLNKRYPVCSPVGAGMVLRRNAVSSWVANVGNHGVTDRKGDSLSSAGDCDMVLHVLGAGWSVAYWPELLLNHLIPRNRLTKKYLSEVSRCAFRDFIKVLDLHGIRPWPSIAPWTLPLRRVKSWGKFCPWKNPHAFIKYHSVIGQYEGQAALAKKVKRESTT